MAGSRNRNGAHVHLKLTDGAYSLLQSDAYSGSEQLCSHVIMVTKSPLMACSITLLHNSQCSVTRKIDTWLVLKVTLLGTDRIGHK